MYCKKCGEELEEESVFCTACGTKIESDSTSDEKPVEKNKGIAIAGFVCALIGIFVLPILGLFGIIFGAITLSNNPNKGTVRSLAIAGLVLGIIDIVWIAVNFAFNIV